MRVVFDLGSDAGGSGAGTVIGMLCLAGCGFVFR